MARIFMTGGTGCIGAATVHHLLQQPETEQVWVTSRTCDTRLLEIWLGGDLDKRLVLRTVDLAEADAMRAALHEAQPTHLIHLGALQSPACDANRWLGMTVNVGGTMLLLETITQLQLPLKRFVFASSAAVYGKRSRYPQPTVSENVPLEPPNFYGVWKVAGEQLLALFHERTGIPVVSLRLNTTFGPGRDQGKTAAPTTALKTLAKGAYEQRAIPFRMPYRGRENYHYVEDVGHHFAAACLRDWQGCGAFNIRGRTIGVDEFLALALVVAEERGWTPFCDLAIADDADPNLFVCDLDDQAIDVAFPGLPRTDIDEGIRRSLAFFDSQARKGTLRL